MPPCVVPGCRGRSSITYPDVTFHRFPQNPTLRAIWACRIKRQFWRPSNSSSICSRHFREEDLDKTSPFRTYIKKGAVPSIFPWSCPRLLSHEPSSQMPTVPEEICIKQEPESDVSESDEQSDQVDPLEDTKPPRPPFRSVGEAQEANDDDTNNIFGKYVAAELKSLRQVWRRNELRRTILEAIIKAGREEQEELGRGETAGVPALHPFRIKAEPLD